MPRIAQYTLLEGEAFTEGFQLQDDHLNEGEQFLRNRQFLSASSSGTGEGRPFLFSLSLSLGAARLAVCAEGLRLH